MVELRFTSKSKKGCKRIKKQERASQSSRPRERGFFSRRSATIRWVGRAMGTTGAISSCWNCISTGFALGVNVWKSLFRPLLERAFLGYLIG